MANSKECKLEIIRAKKKNSFFETWDSASLACEEAIGRKTEKKILTEKLSQIFIFGFSTHGALV